jgi:hypothetical protein
MTRENSVTEIARGPDFRYPTLTFWAAPEIRAAVETLARLDEIEYDELLTGIEIEQGTLKPEEVDPDWDIESKPHETTLSDIVSGCVLRGLEPIQRILQRNHTNLVKTDEGLKQILEFLSDHPEIERATAEYFTQDDPAYPILRRKTLGETESTNFDVPYDRPMAARSLAADEVLLKAYAATSAAIERALRKWANNPEAE